MYINRRNRTLGLWDTEEAAAHAYDIAVLRYRSPSSATNFIGYNIKEIRAGAGKLKLAHPVPQISQKRP